MAGAMLPDLTDGKIPRHDGYDVAVKQRRWLRLSDNGGSAYAKGQTGDGDQILWEYPAEKQNPGSYERRKAQATFPGLLPQAIDDYLALSEVRPVERPQVGQDSPYATLIDDADGVGTSMGALMHDAGRQAMAEGESWLWVDTTVTSATTDAERKAQGGRGVIRRVDPDAVVWWSESHGQVTAAAVMTTTLDGRPALYMADQTDHRTVILDDKGGILDAGEVTPHRFGGCPLVRLRPFPRPFSAPLADVQREAFNYGALKREEVFQQVFTLLVATGVSSSDLAPPTDEDRKSVVTIGASFCVVLENEGSDIKRLEPTAASEKIAMAEQQAIERFYMIARLSPGRPLDKSQPESGVSRKVRLHQQTAILRTLTTAQQSAENTAVGLWSQVSGVPYPGDARYPMAFDVVDDAAETDRAASVLGLPELPPVLREAEIRLLAEKLYSLSPEQRRRLDDELTRAAETPALPIPGRTAGT